MSDDFDYAELARRSEVAGAAFELGVRLASRTGPTLFTDIASFIAETTGCRLVMLCQVADDDAREVEVVAGLLDGAPAPAWSYPVLDTPCGEVLKHGSRCYADGVDAVFPKDPELARLGLTAYAGETLRSETGRRLGLIAVADDTPFAEPDALVAFIRLVAQRVSAELSRERLLASMKRENAFRALLAEVSSDLLALQPGASIEAFSQIIGKIGRFYGADRVTLYRYEEGKVIAQPVGRWRADGMAAREPRIPEAWRMEQSEVLRLRTVTGRPLVVADVDELPEGFANVVRAFGMRSFIHFPVLDPDGAVMGGLAIYSAEANKRWSAEAVRELDLVSKFFTSTALRISAAERAREVTGVLSDALNVNPDAVLLAALETGAVVTANQAYHDLLGLMSEDVVGRRVDRLAPLQDNERWVREWEHIAATLRREETIVLKPFHCVRRDGTRMSIEYSATRVMFRGSPHAFCIARDTSTLNQTLEQLKKTQALARVGAFAYDLATGEMEWTEEAYRIHGFEPDSALTRSRLAAAYTRESRRMVFRALKTCFRDAQPFDLLMVLKRGAERRRLRVIGEPEFAGERCRFVRGTFQDITNLHRVTAERGHFERQLRRAAAELAFAEERERQRLATELHDDIVQDLGALKLGLGQAQRRLRAAGADDGVLEGPLNQTQEIIRKARALMNEISPPVLYELGVFRAIEWISEKVGREAALRAGCEIDPDLEDTELSEEIRVVLFQSVRELLTNIRKHAGARAFSVRCGKAGACIVLSVLDDGIGLELDESADGDGASRPRTEHFGLFNLRNRIEYVGGTVRFESPTSGGTRITVTLPLDANSGALRSTRLLATQLH